MGAAARADAGGVGSLRRLRIHFSGALVAATAAVCGRAGTGLRGMNWSRAAAACPERRWE